jgi:hypothetical protein
MLAVQKKGGCQVLDLIQGQIGATGAARVSKRMAARFLAIATLNGRREINIPLKLPHAG